MQKEINILIVDDDAVFCQLLIDIFSENNCKLVNVGSIALAKNELSKKFYNIILLDLKLPDGSGLDLIKYIKKINEDIAIIVFTGFASLETSISAMNEGAFSYMKKPVNIDELKVIISKALKMQELSYKNKELLIRLKELSLKDSLTGLYNYGYMTERLSSELKRARRYALPFSIIMMDLDYFKSVNDTYGHEFGDLVLRELAHFLKKSARSNDVVVRYGGEEFVVLMPDTDKEGAIKFGRQLLSSIRELNFKDKDKNIKIKLSMGIISFPDDGVEEDSDFLSLVDRVVRYIKETGGDRLCTFEMIDTKDLKSIGEENVPVDINKLKQKLSRMEDRVSHALLELLYGFARKAESNDSYSNDHIEKMVLIVTKIGKEMALSAREMETLKYAAMFHDLGKIAVPNKILQKGGKLTVSEYNKAKKHPEIGADIIKGAIFLKDIVPIIYHHHKRFDDTKISKRDIHKEIPLGAKIVGIADVYLALISDRPYRKAHSKDEALKIIKENSGKLFDPKIVKIFLKILESI
ncbi:MAG: diguanylate cyclase [bacterium]|nr:diguanylate cyclase [bacterium]